MPPCVLTLHCAPPCISLCCAANSSPLARPNSDISSYTVGQVRSYDAGRDMLQQLCLWRLYLLTQILASELSTLKTLSETVQADDSLNSQTLKRTRAILSYCPAGVTVSKDSCAAQCAVSAAAP